MALSRTPPPVPPSGGILLDLTFGPYHGEPNQMIQPLADLLYRLFSAQKLSAARADDKIQAQAGKIAALEAQVEQNDVLIAAQASEIAALKSDDTANIAAIEARIKELESMDTPAITPEAGQILEEMETGNPSATVDELVGAIAADADTATTTEDVPTLGTAEQTPEDVVDAAIEDVLNTAMGLAEAEGEVIEGTVGTAVAGAEEE